MVFKHADTDDKRRWEEFEMRSFVDDNPHITWCTAPGRANEVDVTLLSGLPRL